MAQQFKPKQGLTSVDLAVLVRELRELEGCLIRSVFMPTRDIIILEIDCGGAVKYLIAEGGKRLHLTKYVFTSESVSTARPFKKLLRGGKLVEVGQLGFERVSFLRIRRGTKLLTLYVEVLPRGILSIVDEQGKVLAVNKKLTAKDRIVSVGTQYTPPPSYPNLLDLSIEKLAELVSKHDLTVGQFFVRVLGMAPEIVNEVLNEGIRVARLSQVGISELWDLVDKVRRFVFDVLENPRPCLVSSAGSLIGFYPYRPSQLPEGAEVIEYESMNSLLDEYFRSVDELTITERELRKIMDSKAIIERTLSEAEENLERLSSRLGEVSRIVELFDKYFYDVERIWGCCRKVVKERGWRFISECGPVIGDPSRGTININFPDGSLNLILYKDIKQQYAELRKELEHLTAKSEKAASTVKELRSKLEEIVARRTVLESVRPKPRRTTWYSRFLWIETSGGFLAIGGRDASQNELIVRKYLKPKDIFVHADVHGASAFVILTKGKEVSERDLYEVASVAASFSRAWKAGLNAVDVFWVYGEQVSLSAPPGEYLPKGSFMIYGHKNFIRGINLTLSIGVVYIDEVYDIVIGPQELVSSRAIAYVTVVPGDSRIDEASKEIRDYFVRKCPDVRGLTVQDIAKLLPGRVKIVSKG